MTELNFEIQHKDVFPNREIHETKQLSDRPTVKILLKDTDGMICLTTKTNSNFYTRKFNTARDLRILQLDVCGFIE